LSAQIQHRVDGRQHHQTGEAEIVVFHAGNEQALPDWMNCANRNNEEISLLLSALTDEDPDPRQLSQEQLNHKTYKQLDMEPYFEHGVVKLRYKEPNRKEPSPKKVSETADQSALHKGLNIRREANDLP